MFYQMLTPAPTFSRTLSVCLSYLFLSTFHAALLFRHTLSSSPHNPLVLLLHILYVSAAAATAACPPPAAALIDSLPTTVTEIKLGEVEWNAHG